MSMKHSRLAILIFMISLLPGVQRPVDSWKGVWSGVKKFPLFQASFWTNMGHGFGLPPTGYIYSYSVYNNSNQPIWVGVQKIVSIMGGSFPETGGWSIHPVPVGGHYKETSKEYYFEMLIKTSGKSYSNHMPYLQHPDVIYQQDEISLPQNKNSVNLNYFRAYTGHDFLNGAYVHSPKAEYIGQGVISGTPGKNDVSLSATLSSLNIKNSTSTDYLIGFSPQPSLTSSTMTKSVTPLFALVENNSFGMLSVFSSLTSLCPGTIGLFDKTTKVCLQTIDMGTKVFKEMSYTLEAYQDIGAAGPSFGWQGLMPGHYDMPMNRVKDITPIYGCFWYQSAAQQPAQSGAVAIDLPGSVWVLSFCKKPKILAMATPGQAVQFVINRPDIGDKNQIYFLYVDEADPAKAQAFAQKFLNGTVGAPLTAAYNAQAESLMKESVLLAKPQAIPTTANAAKVVSPALLAQALSGSMSVSKGQIVDPGSKTTGYLLGGDMFLPLGIGKSAMYYTLAPSSADLPTSAVTNVFAETSLVTAPTGMPAPISSSFAPPITVSSAFAPAAPVAG